MCYAGGYSTSTSMLCENSKHPSDTININDTIADLNIKSINQLAKFSFSISSTLSVLFMSYCMNIYGTYIYDTITILLLTMFVFHGGKLLDDYGRHPIDLFLVSS